MLKYSNMEILGMKEKVYPHRVLDTGYLAFSVGTQGEPGLGRRLKRKEAEPDPGP